MNQREQFGGYLLLKKLAEDPLGETFRAGRIGKQGIERVVLLRVFNGQGVDGSRLWQRLRARSPLQQILKSPNLGDGVDMGEVRGIPFVAYDYVSGKSLWSMLEQAEKKRRPVPLDHALLITERIAQALTVAFETRQGEDRVLHGFLVPHLVMLSNEGETRLLGIEASVGLREAASGPAVREAFARYLAPEALAGDPVGKPDDVYSLGVVLFELLTNRRLPPPAANGYGPVVDEAILAGEGTGLPNELGALLKKALTARDHRFGDVQAFHRALAKLMFDGAYNPTTFNLAFFMHNLFRDEIERESQEMEAEKLVSVPAAGGSGAAAQASGAGASGGAATAAAAAPRFGREQTGVGAAPVAEPAGPATPPRKAGGANKGLLFGGIAAGLAVVGVGAWMALSGGGGSSTATSTPPVAADPAAGSAPGGPADLMTGGTGAGAEVTVTAPAGPTAEELQAQMAQLIEERLKSSEAALRKQYDEQIKGLQRQVEEAQRAEKAPAAPPTRPAAEPPAAAATGGATGEPEATTAVAAAAPATSVPVPAPAAPPISAPPATVQTVRLGDLVTMGPGVVPPRVQQESLKPRYPAIARQTGRSAVVVVRVLVDENGKPMDVQLKDSKKVGLGFDEAAMDAARRANFSAATKSGVRVKMWYDLSIKFTP